MKRIIGFVIIFGMIIGTLCSCGNSDTDSESSESKSDSSVSSQSSVAESEKDSEIESSSADHEHEWTKATCTEPRICKICGETKSKALGHNWEPATLTEPKTCKRCGITEGSKLPCPIKLTFASKEIELNKLGFKNEIDYTIKITNIDYEVTDGYEIDDKYQISLSFLCEKTYDKKGNDNMKTAYANYNLIDSEGCIVKQGIFTIDNMKVKDKVKVKEDMYNVSAGDYTVEFIEN